MGLFDRLTSTIASVGGSILGGLGQVGSVAARELGEFAGAVVGGAGAGLGGQIPVTVPRSVGAIPESLGEVLGAGVGFGVRTRLQQEIAALASGSGGEPGAQAGTAGVGPRPYSVTLAGPATFAGYPMSGGLPTMLPSALPGGAPVARAFGAEDILGPLIGGGISALFARNGNGGAQQVANGGALVAPGAGAGTIFRVQGQRLVPRSMFSIVNPYTGNTHWYRSVGRPILFSGDLATCRRVDRIARRVGKARRKR